MTTTFKKGGILSATQLNKLSSTNLPFQGFNINYIPWNYIINFADENNNIDLKTVIGNVLYEKYTDPNTGSLISYQNSQIFDKELFVFGNDTSTECHIRNSSTDENVLTYLGSLRRMAYCSFYPSQSGPKWEPQYVNAQWIHYPLDHISIPFPQQDIDGTDTPFQYNNTVYKITGLKGTFQRMIG